VGGGFVANLGADEGAVLVAVVEHVRGMIRGEAPPGLDALPSLTRLFPPASMTDGDVARDFAALTGKAMRENKDERLGRLAAHLSGATVRLDKEGAADAVAALNDVRLALAEVLGIETPEDADRIGSLRSGHDEPTGMEDVFAEIYVALSALQESLVLALGAAGR
jgi:hypothetical protein